MKAIKNNLSGALALVALALVFTLPVKAQLTDNGYANVDWQFNVPLSNHFADDASGWGMNFEGGYFVTPNIGVGLFLTYHSNHEYVDRMTLTVDNGAMNTDQQHTLFQLPFGVAARYQMNRGGTCQPYFAFKAGPSFAKMTSTYNVFRSREDSWGFYASPEVGINVYPWAYGPGLHLAAYYSYASNKANVLTYAVDGPSNFGLRVGLAF
ncbi:MAG: porin family protein [Bacteroides sp.]